ncbi:MOSC domain-containing protein [Ornithinicoccus halotolerans]|uniref:MOSC domain-containing protein n=1 Tax=Ornithinicoccus halotolerans TaxID=1748220 RepID=UPI001295CB6E|nr:MOSC domain-containing protein [Ornithinicoccus halotolerans]
MGQMRGPLGRVVAVAADGTHRFSKVPRDRVELRAGHGVVGDAHAGATVRHRSRVRRDPTTPNLRQVHLVAVEQLREWQASGHPVPPGGIGENVLTEGVDLLALPEGTLLALGGQAVVRVTGLRNPCRQIDDYRPGLLAVVLPRDEQGHPQLRVGVMAVVERDGAVAAGDPVQVGYPPQPHRPLRRV